MHNGYWRLIAALRGFEWLIATMRSFLFLSFVAVAFPAFANDPEAVFGVQLVDSETGRGIPLAELRTIDHVSFVSDNRGWIAMDDPAYLGREVFFFVSSHGYSYPKDGFGNAGVRLRPEAGRRETIAMVRNQPAERVGRLTGAGRERDSHLLGIDGAEDPQRLVGDVVGCDSVLMTPYRGELFWVWGDTSRPSYPLAGSFHATGATTPFPSRDTWTPEATIPFSYWSDADGSIRPIAEMPGDGPTWLTALVSLPDAASADGEVLMAAYYKIRPPLQPYRFGFCRWDPSQNCFVDMASNSERPLLFPASHSHTILEKNEKGELYVYFCDPFPWTRVKATPEAFADPTQYECWTCLRRPNDTSPSSIEKDKEGKAVYRWRSQVPYVTVKQQSSFIAQQMLAPDDALANLTAPETERRIVPHSGSVAWNPYLKSWIAVFVELGGTTSFLGDVWLATSDTPQGPWRDPQRVITHEKYSFYNPKHHSILDREDGKIIYIEGTYSHTFSGNERPTPRYDYNQVLYELDLSRLSSPLP